MDTPIKFVVNGVRYTETDPQPNDKLVTWLRNKAFLTGTKHMCMKGGCGACVVTVTRTNPATGKEQTSSINACLFPLISCDGCEITTVEGLGSSRKGYNLIQKRFADLNATQCGYCTPGFVMTTHGLLKNDPKPTQEQVEAHLDGNICRCTGYRPILDAMKSFTSDCDEDIQMRCSDIEDIALCTKSCDKKWLQMNKDEVEWKWVRPSSLDVLCDTIKQSQGKRIRLVAGYTSIGVYPETEYDLYVDTKKVPELYKIVDSANSLTLGANVTIANLNVELQRQKKDFPTFCAIYKLTSIMANTHVRNAASWVGNLVMKNTHSDFVSDLFTVLEAAEATLFVCDCNTGAKTNYPLTGKNGFLELNLEGKVVLSMMIPKQRASGSSKLIASSYKVKPRNQNSVAYVNVCFKAVMTDYKITSPPSLVFGGLGVASMPAFVHASNTEAYLVGKDLNSEKTLRGALETLQEEVKPLHGITEYRNKLSLSLFYKFYLTICDPSVVGAQMKSAPNDLQRNVSKGTQSFKPDPTTYPVSKAMPKITSLQQCGGELKYTNDMPQDSQESYATFVLAAVANADIDKIDFVEASVMLGFKKIITAKDLGKLKNSVAPSTMPSPQVLLVESHVDYAGQPIAIVVADSEVNALKIASAVNVTYTNQKPGLYTVKEAIFKDQMFEDQTGHLTVGDADKAIANAEHKITGEVNTGKQYHFYLETQICRVHPTDIGMDVYCATQSQDQLQQVIAEVLGWNANKINIITSRLGGAYGGKAPNSFISGVGGVVAAYLTDSRVRFVTDMKQCMTAMGIRSDYNMTYTVGFNTDGVIQGIDITYVAMGGATPNQADIIQEFMTIFADASYQCENWKATCKTAKGNIATTSQTRSPCSSQLSFAMNTITDHIATVLKKSHIEVQQINLHKKGDKNLFGEPLTYCSMGKVYQDLLESANVEVRQAAINEFNKNNKWKKRGIGISPIKFPTPWGSVVFSLLASIYHVDGSVVISVGGIEMGQGLNTKVVQVAAYVLGIPMGMITIQSATSVTNANSISTGGSIGSDVNCFGIEQCCKILKQRIDAVKKDADKDISWKDLIAKCYENGVNLTAQYTTFPTGNVVQYNAYGTACCEVELDVLTGEHNLKQVDMLYDCGVSINPDIDIGQVEGGFMMGIGMYTQEEMLYDHSNGQLINDSTWTYKPPMSKDIPENWNVKLLPDAPNPTGVLRSKASGEGPLCMADSVIFALKRGIESFKQSDDFVQLDAPATVPSIHKLCDIDISSMTLK